MRNRLRLLAVTAALLIPLSASAEPPTYVTGLQADVIDEEIHVSWTPLMDQDVAFYRVYYSFESILENDGLFDDVEETEDDMPMHIIENPPPVETLYIAVIGVNTAGESADMFVEEIAVDIDVDDEESGVLPEPSGETLSVFAEEGEEVLEVQDETLAIPTEDGGIELPPDAQTPPEVEATRLAILSAQALSPTAILVRFSAPVMVAEEDAPKAFSITDEAGEALPIVRMVIEGPSATITTAPQRPNHSYEFHMKEPAYNPDGLALDGTQASASFLGHPEGVEAEMELPPEETPPVESEVTAAQGVENFALETEKQSNGLYKVTAQWMLIGDVNTLKQYLVYQTRDGGQTFGEPDMVSPDVGGVAIPNVAPGSFGVAVALELLDGTMIQGAVDSVLLEGEVAASLPAQVMSPPGSDLSQTGVGVLALSLICAGAATGVQRMRKRRR